MSIVSAAETVKSRMDRLLGKVLIVRSEKEAALVGSRLRQVDRPVTLGFLNAHAVNLCWRDEDVLRAFSDCDLLLRDGIGVKWLCRLAGLRAGLNMNGTDYIPTLLDMCRNRSIAIFGTARPQLDAAANELRAQGFDIVHVADGFQPDEYYLNLLDKAPVSLVVLAMGMPRQEQCAAYLKRQLSCPCIIICGGAILDFIGGKVKRAPALLRRIGLEWAYRLLREPRRLFSRYVTGGVVFLLRLLSLRSARYRPGPILGLANDLHRHFTRARTMIKSQAAQFAYNVPKIVLVSPGGISGGGGMGSVSRTIAEWFENNSPDACTVVDARGRGSVYLSPLFSLVALVRLCVLRARGAKVLHLQLSERLSFPRKAVFVAAGKLMRMRIIVHHHGAEFIPVFEQASGFYRACVRYVVRSADVNIVLGKDWRDCLVNKVGLGNSRVELLYNSVADIQPQIEILRAIVRRAARNTQFLVLANLSPRKGISEFLQALARLHSTGLQVNAVIAGGGELERYKKEAAERGIAAICHFTGWVGRNDVLKFLAESDAMVLPSYHEGLPISILEGLCAGLPVIATPVGAIPELLRDQHDCLLVPPGDPEALAAAMRSLATDSALAARLRANGRQVYEQKFAVESYMQAMCDIYGRKDLAA